MSPRARTGARPARARTRVKAEAAKACADTGEEAVELLPEGAWPAKRPRGSKARRRELPWLCEEQGGKAKL